MRRSRGGYVWNSRIPRYTRLAPTGRRTREWQTFRRRFLAERRRRDGRLACEECGRETASVDVHHVVKRSIAPQLIREVSNLVVLCRSCHRRKHRC